MWLMRQSLYGHRNAGAGFRAHFEDIVLGAPGAPNRGAIEPTIFYSAELDWRISHHIGDGRVAKLDVAKKVLSHLADHLLLKVSDAVVPGVAIQYLERLMIRLPNAPRRAHHRAGGVRGQPTAEDSFNSNDSARCLKRRG